MGDGAASDGPQERVRGPHSDRWRQRRARQQVGGADETAHPHRLVRCTPHTPPPHHTPTHTTHPPIPHAHPTRHTHPYHTLPNATHPTPHTGPVPVAPKSKHTCVRTGVTQSESQWRRGGETKRTEIPAQSRSGAAITGAEQWHQTASGPFQVGVGDYAVLAGKQKLCRARDRQSRTAQHSTPQHSTAQHSTAQHSTVQHNTEQNNTAHSRTP